MIEMQIRPILWDAPKPPNAVRLMDDAHERPIYGVLQFRYKSLGQWSEWQDVEVSAPSIT